MAMVAPQDSRAVPSQFLKALAGYVVALLAQFILGMALNLFVSVPKNHPGANPPEYFGGVVRSVTWAISEGPSIWLQVHAAFGLVLVAGALGMLARAISFGRRRLTIAVAVGAIGVLAAGFNGGSFLNYHQDFSSMLMASGFALAVASYAFALAIAGGEPARGSAAVGKE